MKKLFESLLIHARQIVKNRPWLGCILKIILRLPTKEFQEYVARYIPPTKIDEEKKYVRNIVLTALGGKNPEKIIVYTEHCSDTGGFCAQWVYFLNRLSFSNKYGFAHVINWRESRYYKEKKRIHGSDNIFEYFFRQPHGISISEAKESENVIIDNKSIDYSFYDAYSPGREDDYFFKEDDIEKFAVIQRKYIKLNKSAYDEINSSIEDLIGKKKVVGVHARGADSKLPYNRHPLPVSIIEYIGETRKAMKKINADYVFLATDDNEILTAFEGVFKDKLLYYKEVERSSGTRMNCYGESGRDNHRYRLGLEIVRDVYTLSLCNGLVCGRSYVAYTARILKKSYEQEYEEIRCINTKLRRKGWNLRDPSVMSKVEDLWNKEISEQEGA